MLPQRTVPTHPTVEVAPLVMVGAIEAASGYGLLQPEHCLVAPDVHPDNHVRLLLIAAEVSLANQNPQEKTLVKV